MIRVLLCSPDGGGFAKYVEVERDCTVGDLLEQADQDADQDGKRLKIRVNRHPADRDTVLVDDDRVSLSYTKLEGAV